MKWGNTIIKILSVDLNSLSLKLKYQDGFIGKVSLKHLFARPKGLTAEILRGGMFSQCFIDQGALAWPNGFELCPDAIRQWIQNQRLQTKKIAA